jgi:single-strand DNA-binding protein
MLKMVAIGHLGKDAEVKIHGTECVINFSVAHSDKWNDNGVKKERTTWVSCSWWTEKHTIAQYLKKGTQVYVEGVPEAKVWKKEGDPQPFLNLRVFSLQLLGSANRDGANNRPADNSNQQQSTGGYVPYEAPKKDSGVADDYSDLPF